MPKNLYSIGKYVALGIMVVVIGALVGWFFVLRSQTESTLSNDAARGFGAPSPIGNAGTFTNGISSVATNTGGEGVPSQVAQLWHVDTTPVAGFGFTTSEKHAVYFAERATGHVFIADMQTGETHRLTNTLNPKTYEAVFARDGSVVLRNVNENTGAIESFAGNIGTSSNSAPSSLIGLNLESNIRHVSANPDSRTLFYLLRDSETTIGIVAPWNGKNEKRVFTSNLDSWRPTILADGRLFVSLLPHDGVAGYAYEIKKDGSLNPLLRGLPGLTFLPQSSSTAMLYGASGGTLHLYLQASSSAKRVELPLKTVADKCGWGPAPSKLKTASSTPNLVYCAVPGTISTGKFLEMWYRGALHTSDALWRINADTGETALIYSPESEGEEIDAMNLAVDPTGGYLGFINSTDASFWMLRLNKI